MNTTYPTDYGRLVAQDDTHREHASGTITQRIAPEDIGGYIVPKRLRRLVTAHDYHLLTIRTSEPSRLYSAIYETPALSTIAELLTFMVLVLGNLVVPKERLTFGPDSVTVITREPLPTGSDVDVLLAPDPVLVESDVSIYIATSVEYQRDGPE
jgi:hypothetical protein